MTPSLMIALGLVGLNPSFDPVQVDPPSATAKSPLELSARSDPPATSTSSRRLRRRTLTAVNRLELELRISGQGHQAMEVEIKPGHSACFFQPLHLRLDSGAAPSMMIRDVVVRSFSVDRDASVEIILREPGHPPKSTRRAVRLLKSPPELLSALQSFEGNRAESQPAHASKDSPQTNQNDHDEHGDDRRQQQEQEALARLEQQLGELIPRQKVTCYLLAPSTSSPGNSLARDTPSQPTPIPSKIKR